MPITINFNMQSYWNKQRKQSVHDILIAVIILAASIAATVLYNKVVIVDFLNEGKVKNFIDALFLTGGVILIVVCALLLLVFVSCIIEWSDAHKTLDMEYLRGVAATSSNYSAQLVATYIMYGNLTVVAHDYDLMFSYSNENDDVDSIHVSSNYVEVVPVDDRRYEEVVISQDSIRYYKYVENTVSCEDQEQRFQLFANGGFTQLGGKC